MRTNTTILALLLLAVSAGCNTCVNAGSVPFRGPDTANLPDASSTDDMSNSDDMSNTPGDMCVPRTTEEICEALDRVCGEISADDGCQTRAVNCGSCGDNGTCDDPGRCVCNQGFDDVDGRCVDIDECATNTDDCAEGTNCTNLPGSFQCSTCPAGTLDVNGDGTLCEDIDECDNGTANCDVLAGCINLEPGFACGECPQGYDDVNGDGTECDDIDECALGLDNCGDADCTNTPGGFICGCPRGTIDVAGICEPVVVVEVTHHTLMMGTGVASVSTAIPGDARADKLVPFASVRASQTGDGLESILTDVWVDTTSGTLMAERSSTTGAVTVEVALVEFGSPSVSMSPFSLGGVAAASPIALTQNESFPVFSYRAESVGRHRDRAMVELDNNGTSQQFLRSDGVGLIQGHLYVVTANDAEFTTLHVDMFLGDPVECITANHAVNDENMAFLLRSHSVDTTDEPTTNGDDTQIRCRLDPFDVECCREYADGTDDITVHASVYIVEFNQGSAGQVQRGQLPLTSSAATTVGFLDPAPLGRSMAFHGANGALGATATAFRNSIGATSFATTRLVSPTQFSAERDQSGNEEAFVDWEVVQWPLLPD